MSRIIRKNILISIIRKEFKQLLRNIQMRGLLFGAPILMLIVFGYAVNTDVKNINLAILDEDKTQISRGIIGKFTSSEYFTYYTSLSSTLELIPLLDSGKVEAFIQIKKGMSKRIKSGKEAAIQIITDGSDSSRAAVIMAYTNEIVSNYFFKEYVNRIKVKILHKQFGNIFEASVNSNTGFKFKKNIQLEERIFFNPVLSSRNFFLPAVIGLLISLITVMLTSMSIVKERESGTIEQIIVSPIRPIEYILGKTIPFAIIGLIDIYIVSIIAILWFDVPFNGSFIFLFIAGLFYILSTLSVGLFISTISRTQQQAMLSTFLFLFPAILLSGFIFPIYSMPEIIQVLTYANPLMYFMEIIRGIFLKGTGIAVLWKGILALLGIGLILIYFSSRRFSRRLE